MHRRETYVPSDTPRARTSRRRALSGGAAVVSAALLAGASSLIASAHEDSRPRHVSAAASWAMPSVDRPLPRVVQARTSSDRRPGWIIRMKHLTPPASLAPFSAASSSSMADEATASASPDPTVDASANPTTSATTSSSAAPSGRTGGSTAGSVDRLFSSSSPWNTPIAAGVASDPDSSQIVDRVLDNPSLVMNLNMYAFGIPFYTAGPSTPRIGLGGNSPVGPVPLEPQWRPNDGADHKMNVIDPTTRTVYELQGFDPAQRSVTWAVKKDYTSSLGDGYPQDGMAGPTGSGLTQSGGVVRLAEIASGRIDHALSFITSRPVNRYRYPASHSDGNATGIGLEEGMRIQLDPTLDLDSIAGITPGEKTIARALQRYGAYCTDTGGGNNQAMGFYVEKPKAGDKDPYPSAGFAQDWAQLPHIPRDRLRVLSTSATPRPN